MAAFAVTTVCFSCSKDDGGHGDYAQLIVGSWNLDTRYDSVDQIHEHEGAIYTFLSDGSGYSTFTDEGHEGDVKSWRWTISGSTLTLSVGSEQLSVQIQKLTENELIFVERYTENGISGEYTMYCSRIR